MDRHRVFILDADPPRAGAGTRDVMFDIFTTGMWVGHALFWMPAALFGVLLGYATTRSSRHATG